MTADTAIDILRYDDKIETILYLIKKHSTDAALVNLLYEYLDKIYIEKGEFAKRNG